MIGNDIVDLHLSHKSQWWNKKRILAKVFTQKEYEHLRTADDPQLELWRMWSMKESAYKAYVQKYGQTFFSPIEIECQVISKIHGKVNLRSRTFDTLTECFEAAVHSLAFTDSEKKYVSECRKAASRMQTEISDECYKRLLASYSHTCKTDIRKLKIAKNQLGIPLLYESGSKQDISLSISHHGRYFAFAYS